MSRVVRETASRPIRPEAVENPFHAISEEAPSIRTLDGYCQGNTTAKLHSGLQLANRPLQVRDVLPGDAPSPAEPQSVQTLRVFGRARLMNERERGGGYVACNR